MRPEPDSELEAASVTCITVLVFALTAHSHDWLVADYVNADYAIGSPNYVEIDHQFGTVRRSSTEPIKGLIDYCAPFIDEALFNALADEVGATRLTSE